MAKKNSWYKKRYREEIKMSSMYIRQVARMNKDYFPWKEKKDNKLWEIFRELTKKGVQLKLPPKSQIENKYKRMKYGKNNGENMEKTKLGTLAYYQKQKELVSTNVN